jgi:CheY-like chemotaxis protein
VYGLVTQSGGHVRIASAPGRGTIVSILLPVSPDLPRESTGSVGAEPRARPGETVLLVEDDPMIRELTVAMVENLGYAVRAAANGAEALAVLGGDQRLDVLIADVVLPGGLNGYEIAQRATVLRAGLPVLFMSGFTADAIPAELRNRAEFHLISKPFKKVELARRLDAMLHRDQP